MEQENPILHLAAVTIKTHTGKVLLDCINLDVFPGEIVGIAGVEGNGQTELIEVVTGLRKVQDGIITLNGDSMVNATPAKFRENGIVHLPADRHRHGISLDSRIDENLIVGQHKRKVFCKNGILNPENIRRFSMNALDKYQIRVGDISHPIKTLSGGNQQKVVVARELSGGPTVIIAAHPTRGLDIHAADFVHSRLLQARNRGKSVVLVSSELDELLKLSDRIAVMYNGKIAAVVKTDETDRQALGKLMLGIGDLGV